VVEGSPAASLARALGMAARFILINETYKAHSCQVPAGQGGIKFPS
jgi:hypothetical protein